MKLKKLASILLTLCLIIAMMPLAVFADDPAERDGDRWGKDLYILGRKVDTTGYIPASIPHKGTIHYNAKTKTLVLTQATLDLNDYRMEGAENNYAAAICAWDDIRIVLVGENRINAGDIPNLSNKDYVYGIKNSGGDTDIIGSGDAEKKLEVVMSSSGGKEFTGIDCKRMLTIGGCDVNVSMTGPGTGVDLFGDFGISDSAKVTVSSNDEDGTAVDGTGLFTDSYVKEGAILTMSSPGTAFKCYMASDALASLGDGAKVGMSTDGTGAETWDDSEYLAQYRYVQFDARGRVEPPEKAKCVYILGRKIAESGIVSQPDVPHEGTISYDKENNTLTLEDASLDLSNFVVPSSGANMVVGIYSTSDLKIVLAGDSKIISTNENYGNQTEYVYGIDTQRGLDISGSGTLTIALAGATAEGNVNVTIYGIGADDTVNVETAWINIDMGNKNKSNGMYLWGPLNLSGAATVRITSRGSSSYGLNGINDIAKSTVTGESMLEIISYDNIAFNCYSAGAGLKEAGAMVNREPSAENAGIWNKSTWLREFKYVRIPADEPDNVPVPVAEEFSISYDLNGGTLDGQTGVVTKKIASGTVITLPLPTRTGYEFDYWEGSKYNAGDKYTVSEDHTFKAIWKTAKTTDTGSKDKGKSSGVKTGDDSTLYTWIALMAISVLGFACVAIGRKISGRNR